MTREELIAKLIESRTRKTVLTWQQLLSAFASSSQDLKDQLIQAIADGKGDLTLTTLLVMVGNKRRGMATDQVNEMVADDRLSVDDLIALLD